jgi:hypothetical protein
MGKRQATKADDTPRYRPSLTERQSSYGRPYTSTGQSLRLRRQTLTLGAGAVLQALRPRQDYNVI